MNGPPPAQPAAKTTPDAPRRSLILAGGGAKVAFQAGVLQVWLDEAGLTFDHADGASGGTFNLAMYCQGMTGTQIADNWRTVAPLLGIDPNWQEYVKLIYAESVLTLDRYRKHVLTAWGLDWEKIRASPREATFNTYNFSRHELNVLTPDQMTEDWLIACVSLPMWFPPVVIDGETFIDAVYVTDANLEEAIQRGADELWVIWTVSDKGEWRDGFVANYFQIIEAAANGRFKQVLHRIEVNNGRIAAGGVGEFGRHIAVYLLQAEVPVHYLVHLSTARLADAVNRGVVAARRWCEERGIPLREPDERPIADTTKLSFRETMKGFVGFGQDQYEPGAAQGRRAGTSLTLRLQITIDGVTRFIVDPARQATARGIISGDAFGDERLSTEGTFHLFVDDGDPSRKQMRYRLFFVDGGGRQFTLSGVKTVVDDPGFDLWRDTSTLHVRILRGHVDPEAEAAAEVVAAGILSIHFPDFLRQLTTFRVDAPTAAERAATMSRFGAFFLGQLWDVYARQILSSGPF